MTKDAKRILFMGHAGLELSLNSPSTNQRTEKMVVRNERMLKEAMKKGFLGPEYFTRVEDVTGQLDLIRDEVMRLAKEAEDDVDKEAAAKSTTSSSGALVTTRHTTGAKEKKAPNPADSTDRQKGWVHESRGGFFQAIGFTEEALDAHRAARLWWKKANDEILQSLALMNEGYALEMERDYDKAMKAYTSALKIREKTLPPYHPHLSVSLRSIAELLVKMTPSDLARALPYYERAVSVDTAALKLRLLHDAVGEISNTEQILEEHSAATRQLAIARINYGSILLNLNRVKDACEQFEEAGSIMRDVMMRVVRAEEGGIGENAREVSEAMRTGIDHPCAYDLTSSVQRENCEVIRNAYNFHAVALAAAGEYDRALTWFQMAILYFNDLMKIAPVPDTSRDSLLRAMDQHLARVLELNEELAVIKSNMAEVYSKMPGKARSACECCDSSLELFRTVFPPNHPRLLEEARRQRAYYHKFGEEPPRGDE